MGQADCHPGVTNASLLYCIHPKELKGNNCVLCESCAKGFTALTPCGPSKNVTLEITICQVHKFYACARSCAHRSGRRKITARGNALLAC
jgi:hypothetical protein